MITVNSVSGGKTSAYLSNHYPADYDVFSLVRIDDPKCTPKDKGLVQRVSDKIGMEFIATAESDLTLKAVLDLEQLNGRKIYWVTGKSFDEVINSKSALPNIVMRFCTTEMKMLPIFKFCQNIAPIVDMRIGFRYDEIERSQRQRNTMKVVVGKHDNGNNKWDEIEWRICSYPLIENKIIHYHIKQWADKSPLVFPEDSNCVGCFWKPYQQLRKNWDDEPNKMEWFADMERKTGRQFKKEMSMSETKTIGLQQSFTFGTGSGCQAGFCTD